MSAPAATAVAVELSGERAHARTLESGEFLRPCLLDSDGSHMTIALVGVCASLLGGDHLQLHIRIGPGVHLEITEPSGTVAYDARGAQSSWNATVHVAAGSTLVWPSAPFVVADGANTGRHTDVRLEEGATALLGETLVLGRSAESGGALHASTHAAHAGRDLLVEEIDLRKSSLRSAPGLLGSGRVLATMTLLGVDLPEVAPPHETRLAGPGALARSIADQAHQTEAMLHDTWRRWRRQLARTAPVDSSCPGIAQPEPLPLNTA